MDFMYFINHFNFKVIVVRHKCEMRTPDSKMHLVKILGWSSKHIDNEHPPSSTIMVLHTCACNSFATINLVFFALVRPLGPYILVIMSFNGHKQIFQITRSYRWYRFDRVLKHPNIASWWRLICHSSLQYASYVIISFIEN